MTCLSRLHLAGFKSIREIGLDFGRVTMLIGANGSGKSNLVSFFRMMSRLVEQHLQLYVGESGGADALLHYGSRATSQIGLELQYEVDAGPGLYLARLVPAAPDALAFGIEAVGARPRDLPAGAWAAGNLDPKRIASFVAATREVASLGHGHRESLLPRQTNERVAAALSYVRGWRPYHFHDTSQDAGVRKQHYKEDCQYLRGDASNLAPCLWVLRERHREYYDRIVATIRLAAPFFGDFVVDPLASNPNNVMLNWTERDRDYLFGPHHLSDGTLRFAALATLFLQPKERLPSLIVVDEPELGLHPYALGLLGSMVRSVSHHTQVILSTQSVPLIDEFKPEDIVVMDRREGETVCRRLEPEELGEWLEDYSVSELWEKNVIGGRPGP